MCTTPAPSKDASPDLTFGLRPGSLGRLGLWVTHHTRFPVPRGIRTSLTATRTAPH